MWDLSDLAASPTAPARPLPLRLLGDERLARLAAGGSERAFAVLYERHHQSLYRYARTIVRHDEDARDVLQTTMARALTALGRRGVPDAPMRPWLFRIAHNEAVSVLRRRGRTIELEEAPEPVAPSLEARVEERSRLTTLVGDLQDLPVRQRSALVMRELSGLSHEEIAGALEISVSAAKQAIFDARTGLHDFAKGRAMECADVQRIVSERDGRMLRGRPVRAHLRGCAACRAMRDAIGARRADLAALAPPLPAAAATGLLSGLVGGGGTGGIATKVAAGTFAAKALAGAAVVATVAVGTVEVAPRVVGAHDGDAAPPAAAAPAARARAAAPVVVAAAAAGPAGVDRASVAATARPVARRAPAAPVAHAHQRHAAASASAAARSKAHPSHPVHPSHPAHPATGSRAPAHPAHAVHPPHPPRPAVPAHSANASRAAVRPTHPAHPAHPTPAVAPAAAAPAHPAHPATPAATPPPATPPAHAHGKPAG
jgi:RNA polymerase sigma factor (sigma-70 family)